MEGRPRRAPPGGLVLWGVVLTLVVSWASVARAQSCPSSPGAVLETFPASGSRGIPVNGSVVILYCASEQPLVDRSLSRLLVDRGPAGSGCECDPGEECIEVRAQQSCVDEVPTSFFEDNDVVRLEASTDLLPMTTYFIEAPEPAGLVYIYFMTGIEFDDGAPVFSGLESVRIMGCGEGFPANAACPIQLDGEGFIAILRAPAASDSAGAVNVEYRAFQVRCEELIERGRVRGDGVSEVTISVFIASEDLTSGEWERICFDMSACDPYGHETSPARTICEFTPEFSPFGSACAVSEQPFGGLEGVLGLIAALVIVLGFRASSRRSRCRSARRSA